MFCLPLLGMIGILPFVSGCASIFQGTVQDVEISSVPTGASVTIDGKAYGTTPVTAELKRKDNHVLRIELAGYQPFDTTITSSISVGGVLVDLGIAALGAALVGFSPDGTQYIATTFIGNALLYLGLDALIGGIFKFSPETVATLNKASGGLLELDAHSLTVILKPDSSVQRNANMKSVKE
jgi:hypothetical protein